jgi:hypothetical protein
MCEGDVESLRRAPHLAERNDCPSAEAFHIQLPDGLPFEWKQRLDRLGYSTSDALEETTLQGCSRIQ